MSRTMHPQSPELTISRTVLKESVDLVILGVTFDSKLTFEKHLRLVSRAASQWLVILGKSWRVLHDRSLLERRFRCFALPVLEYCSAVWWSAADTHIKLLDCAVSGARFLTGGVFECDISNLRSVAVLRMLYKISCNPMHHSMMRYLDRMCQCGLHAVPWSHIGILMRQLAAESRNAAGLLFPSQCPSGTIFLTPYSMVWDWRVSRAGQCFFMGLSCSISTIVFYYFSLSLLPVYRLVLWGWGLRTYGVYITLSQPCTADLF